MDDDGESPAHPAREIRIRELDGLRGVAIALVLYYHLFAGSTTRAANAGLHIVARLGMFCWSGVDLFFVLSGFLIGGILLDARNSTTYYRTFYVRRAFRILPLYVVLSAAPLIVSVFFRGSEQRAAAFWGHPFPWYISATFTQNIWFARRGWGNMYMALTWSLAIEEQFYLALPLLIRSISRQSLIVVSLATITGAPMIRLLAAHFVGPLAPYTLVVCRADALMFGVLAAILVRSRPAGLVLGRHTRVWVMTIALATGLVLLVFFKNDWNIGSRSMNSGGYSAWALFFTCVLLAALDPRNASFRRLLRTRLLVGLGAMAYGLYLLHQLVQFAIYYVFTHDYPRLRQPKDFAALLVALAVTFVLAGLSWRYFEKPLIKIGHRVKYEHQPLPVTRTAPN